MKRTRIFGSPIMSLGSLCVCLSFANAAEAGSGSQESSKALTVEEIVQKTSYVAYYQGQSGRAQVSMTIKDRQGRERKRQFAILRRNDIPESAAGTADLAKHTGDQKFYVYFHRPADVRGMAFMVWKHVDKDDDRWLYLPALDLVKRIAASDKRTSFVGSDFFYEDVSGRGIEEDVHELVKTSENYFLLKNTPKKPDEVEFSHFTMWIHRKTFLPVKIEYFAEGDEKYRVYDALKVETIQGYPTVVQSRMQDLRRKSETVIEYSDVKYDLDLPDTVFTERYLRRAPTRYLR